MCKQDRKDAAIQVDKLLLILSEVIRQQENY